MEALDALLRVDPDRPPPLQQLIHMEAEHMHLWRRHGYRERLRERDSMLHHKRLKAGELVLAQRILPVEQPMQLAERREHRQQLRHALVRAKRSLVAIRANELTDRDNLRQQL
eukprot:3764600-Prymnesium_polylepis.1